MDLLAIFLFSLTFSSFHSVPCVYLFCIPPSYPICITLCHYLFVCSRRRTKDSALRRYARTNIVLVITIVGSPIRPGTTLLPLRVSIISYTLFTPKGLRQQRPR